MTSSKTAFLDLPNALTPGLRQNRTITEGASFSERLSGGFIAVEGSPTEALVITRPPNSGPTVFLMGASLRYNINQELQVYNADDPTRSSFAGIDYVRTGPNPFSVGNEFRIELIEFTIDVTPDFREVNGLYLVYTTAQNIGVGVLAPAGPDAGASIYLTQLPTVMDRPDQLARPGGYGRLGALYGQQLPNWRVDLTLTGAGSINVTPPYAIINRGPNPITINTSNATAFGRASQEAPNYVLGTYPDSLLIVSGTATYSSPLGTEIITYRPTLEPSLASLTAPGPGQVKLWLTTSETVRPSFDYYALDSLYAGSVEDLEIVLALSLV